MKKFLKYASLVIIMLLGLLAIGLLVIFFVPNLTLFNITAINYNKTLTLENDYKIDDVDMIVLKSERFDITVDAQNTEKIECTAYANTFGYAIKQNSNFSMKESFKAGILTIEIDEPSGVAFTNNSNIRLVVPKSTNLSYQFENISSSMIINKDVDMLLLAYETKSGSLKLNNCSVNSEMLCNIAEGSVEISKDSKVSNVDVTLSLTNGEFNSYANLKSVDIKSIGDGTVNLKDCQTLKCSSNGAGKINANEISVLAEIKSVDTDVNLGKTNSIICELSGSGSINITEVNGVNTFNVNDGDISIEKITYIADIKSGNGKVNINKAYKKVSVKSNSNDIIINFAEDAGNFVDDNESRCVNAELVGGYLKVDGVDNITADLKNSASCNITINTIVGGKNEITSEDGSISILTPALAQYKLQTKTNGSVKVNLLQIPQYGGYTTNEETTTLVNCTSEPANSLIVKSNNGSILILDKEIANL